MIDSKHLINLIKFRYLNEQGLLSATYPASEKNLLTDMEDFIPAMLYFGEDKFIKNQILRSAQIINDYNLVCTNGRIISYSNNEFVGGIARYYKSSLDESVKPILDKAISQAQRLLTKEGVIVSYYNTMLETVSSISAPISGGMIEVFIENEDIYPELGKTAYKSLDMWISQDFFKKQGLFPSKYHLTSELWNKLFNLTYLPVPLKIFNRIGVNFFKQSSWNNLIYNLPIGIKVQTAKDNTNMVFALIEAFRKTKNDKYRNAIKWWFKNFSRKMIIDNKIFRFWQPHGKPKYIQLDHVIPVIDILCDIYYFVEKDEFYLEFASNIIETTLNEILWPIRLLPTTAGGHINLLDIQTDFIVSLCKYSELSGNKKYKQFADNIFKAIQKYHYTDDGFVNSVNKKGNIHHKAIMPKYNALLLKTFILNENPDFEIYGSDYNHSLMKDR